VKVLTDTHTLFSGDAKRKTFAGRDQLGDGLAVAGDDNRLAFLHQFKQSREFAFCLMCVNLHKFLSIRAVEEIRHGTTCVAYSCILDPSVRLRDFLTRGYIAAQGIQCVVPRVLLANGVTRLWNRVP
jgi:hypothetical protein